MKSKLFLISFIFIIPPLFLPQAVLAQSVSQLPNPLSRLVGGGTVVDIVYAAFAGFVGLFALLAFGFLIFSAFRLLISHGNEEKITQGKSGVTWSVLGMVVAILSYSVISAVGRIFHVIENQNEIGSSVLRPPFAGCGGTDFSFVCVFNYTIYGVLGVSFVASVLMLVWGGFRMIFSAGNEEAVTAAKRIITWAVAGLALVLLSYSIILGVNALFS